MYGKTIPPQVLLARLEFEIRKVEIRLMQEGLDADAAKVQLARTWGLLQALKDVVGGR